MCIEGKSDRKTQMCIFKNCYRKDCWFAHTFDELEPPKCMYNNLCNKGSSCIYLHSFETKHDYVKRLNMKERKRGTNKKSKLCMFGKDCTRVDCGFAHSVEGIMPIACLFGIACKMKDSCKYIHPNECRDEFIKRITG